MRKSKSDITKKNTAKRNMSSTMCASSMYSRLCMEMSSFLFVRVCAMPRMLYIYHVEFHFRFRCLVSFPVKHQLWSGCHGEKSSKKNIR